MKNPHYEFLGRRMREYHRTHQWRLSDGGLYIPHVYGDMESETLSSWDDVGFILNGRRIIVWWKRPRRVYEDTISSMAWEEAGACVIAAAVGRRVAASNFDAVMPDILASVEIRSSLKPRSGSLAQILQRGHSAPVSTNGSHP